MASNGHPIFAGMDATSSSSSPENTSLVVRAPHFPYAYATDVERFGDQVYAYASSKFSWPNLGSNGQGLCKKPRDEMQMRRDELEVLDEQLRISILEIEVLRQSLRRAENIRKRMEEAREKQWAELQNLRATGPRTPSLPTELVSRICSFTWMEIDSELLEEAAMGWGELLFKSVPFRATVGELSYEDEWKRATKLLLDIHHTNYDLEEMSRMLEKHQWVLKRRLQVSIEICPGPRAQGREFCLGILAKCEALVMEKLIVKLDGCDNWHRGDVVPSHVLVCVGCTGDVDAPRCKAAEILLRMLPCLGPMLKSLRSLTVTNVDIAPTSPIPNFPSYFRHLDTTRL